MLENIVSLINSSDAHGLKEIVKRRGAKRYIHRQLILRLIAAAAVISLFLAVVFFCWNRGVWQPTQHRRPLE